MKISATAFGLEQPPAILSMDSMLAVNKLRQALGDSANQPRYVETLSGRGYRFVAPVHTAGGAALELVPEPAEPEQTEQRSRRGLPFWAACVAALVVVLLGVSWLLLHRPSVAPMKATRFLISPPKGYYLEGGGIRQSFALSPDGERIAFTAKDASGSFRLFVREFSALSSDPVVDGEGAYSVVWTPDSHTLLFAAKGKLRRIRVNASASQILSDVVPYFSSAIPFGPGRLLVSNPRNSGVMPSSGGTLQPIDRVYSWAQSLPGSRKFLYTVDDPQIGSLRASIADVGSNDPGLEIVRADSRVQYTDSLRSDAGYLVFLRSGTLLAQPFDLATQRVTAEPKAIARHVPSFGPTGAADFSVSQSGVLAYQSFVNRSQFIWVDRTGKRLGTASPADISATFVRLSPDGRWVAAVPFNVERGMPEIWVYDAVNGAGRKVVFGSEIPGTPVWSPDSRRLVYLSGRCWPRLNLTSLDASSQEESLPDTGFMAPSDWSSDGRYILYNNSALPAITQAFASDVFAIDMARGKKVIPLLNTPFYESSAVFSPDGKWLAFLSSESGEAQIYMQALDRSNDGLRVTGERFLVSQQGAQSMRWPRNGKELFYLGYDGKVYAVPIGYLGANCIRGSPSRFSRSTPKRAQPFIRLSPSTFPLTVAGS